MLDNQHPRRSSYFLNAMDDVRQLFAFHPKLNAEVEDYGTGLFKSDVSHKMCVHIRTTDFVNHAILQETKVEFLIPAMETVKNFLSQKYSTRNISLMFIADNETFVDSLEFPNNHYYKIYRPQLPSRGAVMCFGATYCDSLLISAGASTFASWIGFLMPKEKDIFYNRRTYKNSPKYNRKRPVSHYRFPKYWHGLELDEKNNTVFLISK